MFGYEYEYKKPILKVVLILIVSFTFIYYIFRSHFDTIENPIDALYFSAVVSSTVGFGDIKPKTKFGRFIVFCNICCTMAVIYALVFKDKK